MCVCLCRGPWTQTVSTHGEEDLVQRHSSCLFSARLSESGSDRLSDTDRSFNTAHTSQWVITDDPKKHHQPDKWATYMGNASRDLRRHKLCMVSYTEINVLLWCSTQRKQVTVWFPLVCIKQPSRRLTLAADRESNPIGSWPTDEARGPQQES